MAVNWKRRQPSAVSYRTVVLNGRLPPAEASRLADLAAAAGVSISVYVAKVLHAHLVGADLRVESGDSVQVRRVPRLPTPAPAPGPAGAAPVPSCVFPADFQSWPRSKRRAWALKNGVSL